MSLPVNLPDFTTLYTDTHSVKSIIQALFWFLLAIIFANLSRSLVRRGMSKYASMHHTVLIGKVAYYIIFVLFLLPVLNEFDLEIATLLGAAGILTAAVAFASQTPMTNFISGVCLLIEKPFEIGDLIEFNDILGEVIAIDLLSVKLRTRDNTLIRVPNEQLLKSQFKTVTRFPIRRFDLEFKVGFFEDIKCLRQTLLSVAKNNPLALETPLPELHFIAFSEFAIQLRFTVWAKRDAFFDLKNSFPFEIQEALQQQGIYMPVPQREIFQKQKEF